MAGEQLFGAVIYRGKVSWTANQDVLGTLDITCTPPKPNETYTVYLRNGSDDVDLVAIIGTMVPCYSGGTVLAAFAVTPHATADDFTSASAHGLSSDDAVVFTGTGGGVTAGTTYYVLPGAGLTSVKFQVSAARGGAAFDVTNATANTCSVPTEFFEVTRVSVPKFAAGSSTAVLAGLVAVQVQGWPNNTGSGRICFAKGSATASAFNAYVEIRRS